MGTPDNVPGTADPSPHADRTASDLAASHPSQRADLSPRLAQLRVVAITDRRLMVPGDLLATADWPAIAAAFGHAIQRAVAACPPGSVVVQVREKDLDGRPLLQLVRAALPFASIVVNERLDVALAAHADVAAAPGDVTAAHGDVAAARGHSDGSPSAHGAHGIIGVHLPDRGLPVADARALLRASGVALAIGVSRHAPPLDEDVDLIQLGPIWSTPSKPSAPPLGERALAWPHGRARLVAVGGIDSPERAQRAATAGADAVAVIRAAWHGSSLAPLVAAVEAGLARR
jgi:thiamine monophosphate synthase